MLLVTDEVCLQFNDRASRLVDIVDPVFALGFHR
jgi:hypothetical protein